MTKITGDFCNHRKANNDNNNSTFIFCFSKCIRCVQRVCKLFSFFPFMQISSSKALKLLLLSNSIWPLLVYSYMLLLLVCLYRLMKIISTISPICFKWQSKWKWEVSQASHKPYVRIFLPSADLPSSFHVFYLKETINLLRRY